MDDRDAFITAGDVAQASIDALFEPPRDPSLLDTVSPFSRVRTVTPERRSLSPRSDNVDTVDVPFGREHDHAPAMQPVAFYHTENDAARRVKRKKRSVRTKSDERSTIADIESLVSPFISDQIALRRACLAWGVLYRHSEMMSVRSLKKLKAMLREFNENSFVVVTMHVINVNLKDTTVPRGETAVMKAVAVRISITRTVQNLHLSMIPFVFSDCGIRKNQMTVAWSNLVTAKHDLYPPVWSQISNRGMQNYQVTDCVKAFFALLTELPCRRILAISGDEEARLTSKTGVDLRAWTVVSKDESVFQEDLYDLPLGALGEKCAIRLRDQPNSSKVATPERPRSRPRVMSPLVASPVPVRLPNPWGSVGSPQRQGDLHAVVATLVEQFAQQATQIKQMQDDLRLLLKGSKNQ